MENSVECDMLIGRILYLGVPVFAVILFMICGNSFVVLSIFLFKSIRSIRTCIIASLALADLLVAITVLPFAAIDLICRRWVFPQSYCSFYIMLDFISCQSSIFHICLIAVEQYITISSPLRYTQIKRTLKIFVSVSIVAIWTLSVVIAYYFTHYTERYNTELLNGGNDQNINAPYPNKIKFPHANGILMNNNLGVGLNVQNYAFSGSGALSHIPSYVDQHPGYLVRLNRHFQSIKSPIAYEAFWTPSNKRQYPSISLGSKNVRGMHSKLGFLVAVPPNIKQESKSSKAVNNLGDENCLYLSKLSTNFALLVFVGGFLIPMAVTVAVYWKIYRIVTYHVTSMISQYDATLMGQQKQGRKLGLNSKDINSMHLPLPFNSKVMVSWAKTKRFFKSTGDVDSLKENMSSVVLNPKLGWKERTLSLKIVNKISSLATLDDSHCETERPTTVNSISPRLSSTSPNSLPCHPLLPKNNPSNRIMKFSEVSFIVNQDQQNYDPTLIKESIIISCDGGNNADNNIETRTTYIFNDPVRYAKYTEKRKSINHDIISPLYKGSTACPLTNANPGSPLANHACVNFTKSEINNANNYLSNNLTDRYVQLSQPQVISSNAHYPSIKTNFLNIDGGIRTNSLAPIPSYSLTQGRNQCTDKCNNQSITNKSPSKFQRRSVPLQNKLSISQRSSKVFRGHFRRSKNRESTMYANIRSNRELVKEKKAIKTLGMVLGTFLFCWTPYFIVFLLQPYCNFCVPVKLFVSVTWLGYLNSALNPIIYAIYNKKFRRAFKALMMCQTKIYKRSDHID